MGKNSMYFNKEMIDAGQLTSFLRELMEQSYGEGGYYNDIHVFPTDLGAFVVEWAQVPWDQAYGGSFQYVEDDQVVMSEYKMPDGAYQYFETEEDYTEAVKDFLNSHSTYKQDQYGRWYDEATVEATETLRKELGLKIK